VISFELLLPIGALGFYLFDSAALLYGNEFIFTLQSNRWAWSAGSEIILRGRRLYLPNPFTPQRLCFRTAWSEGALEELTSDIENIVTLQRAVRPLAVLDQWLLILILLVMPVVIALLGTGVALLAVFAACYLTVLVMIGVACRRRAQLGLSPRQLLSLSFDSALCPPFAINLVRKIGLRQRLVRDPVAFARANCSPIAFAALLSAICKRLDLDLSELDPTAAKSAQLQAYRAHLESLSR
jgi:hypothetical protein